MPYSLVFVYEEEGDVVGSVMVMVLTIRKLWVEIVEALIEIVEVLVETVEVLVEIVDVLVEYVEVLVEIDVKDAV